MDEQTQGLNVETASAEGTLEADGGFDRLFLEAFDAGTGDAPATGDAGDAAPEADEGETPQVPATDETEAGESNPPTGDGEPPVPEKPSPRILRFRDNHEEHELDVNAASDAEIIEAFQKSRMYDRVKAAQAEHADAEKFRAAVESKMKTFLDDYGTEGAKSLAVAGAMADGMKVYPITVSEDGSVKLTKNYLELPEIESAPKPSQPAAPTPDAPKAPSDLASELRKLRKAFPTLTEIPQDVEALHNEGYSYVEAMFIHRMNQAQTKAAETAKENKQLKQRAEAASRAPVRGVSGGGNPPKPNGGLSENESAFLAGFDGKSPIRHA